MSSTDSADCTRPTDGESEPLYPFPRSKLERGSEGFDLSVNVDERGPQPTPVTIIGNQPDVTKPDANRRFYVFRNEEYRHMHEISMSVPFDVGA
jgi:hypothetical protein